MPRERRRRGPLAALLCVVLLAAGCGPAEGAITSPIQETAAPAAPPPLADASPKSAEADPPPPDPAPDPEGIDPERVRIPSIGVEAVVVDLGLNPDRTLQVPEDFSQTGWWTGGSAPGARGPAVIVGHVDSRTGPAVFYDLRKLVTGDEIEVLDAAGTVVRYRVDRLEQHPKEAFPTDAVYGDTDEATLRLITCGGDFNRGTGHYVDNLIVFASLAT